MHVSFGKAGLDRTGLADPSFVLLAGDGRDDYLYVGPTGKVTMFRNAGGAPDEGPNAGKVQWVSVGEIAAGVGGRGDQIRFADLDGDGRAEYLWYVCFAMIFVVLADQYRFLLIGSRTLALYKPGGTMVSAPRKSIGVRQLVRRSPQVSVMERVSLAVPG